MLMFSSVEDTERMRRDPGDRSSYEETTALIQELDALKQRGSNLLVVGSRIPAAHRAACQQFLGGTDTEPRRRVFALADPCVSVDERLPSVGANPDRLRIVRYPATNRSTAPVQSGSASAPGSETTVDHADPGELGLAISEAIGGFEATSGGLSPAELRLCFDSLAPLLSEHDPETMFRFLHLLTHRVRSVEGMAHYHLTTDRGNRTIALLEPLFDAVIELRPRESTLYQRWSLRDSGLTTGWLEL